MSAVLFARATDAAVGSFHYPFGLVEFTLSDDAKAVLESPAGAAGRDTAELVPLAYEASSYFHEMRHFVDCFGTLAGLTLFSGRIELMKEFAALSAAVRARDGHWPRPPLAWARDPTGPQVVRDFVRKAQAFDNGQRMYLAPLAPVEVDGHLDDLRVEVDIEGGGKADASPLRMVIASADGKTRNRSVLYPLGLEALFEATAHAVARSFVERRFPAAVGAAFERRTQAVRAATSPEERMQRAAQTATPYMVVDILVTRFLRAHGVQTFPRDLVLALVDRVLATSSIQSVDVGPGQTAMHIDRVGLNLHQLLQSTDTRALAAATLPAAPDIEAAYAQMLADYERGGEWHDVHDDLSPMSAIRIWETWVAKTCVIPLLRARLETKGRAFSTFEGFLELLQTIGTPPVRVANGHLMFADGMPDRVKQAWTSCMMLGELMWQSARSSGAVLCPRAHATVHGLASMNLAFAGRCNTHRLLGCGTHGGETPSPHRPSCLFEDTLRATGLRATA